MKCVTPVARTEMVIRSPLIVQFRAPEIVRLNRKPLECNQTFLSSLRLTCKHLADNV